MGGHQLPRKWMFMHAVTLDTPPNYWLIHESGVGGNILQGREKLRKKCKVVS